MLASTRAAEREAIEAIESQCMFDAGSYCMVGAQVDTYSSHVFGFAESFLGCCKTEGEGIRISAVVCSLETGGG